VQLADLVGLVDDATGLRLADLAAAVSSAHCIVELGSYKGKSSCYLGAGARSGGGAHVFCIDAWDLPANVSGRHGYAEPGVRAVFDAQVRAMGLERQITAVQARSIEPARTWPTPVGLLFIDASHLYEDVKADFEAWRPLLVPEGTVAFDDYDTPRNPGVLRFVTELRRATPRSSWDFSTPPLAIVHMR